MMAKKGFDLAALAREQIGAGEARSVDSVREIPLADIDVNAANFYGKSNLEELAANIELLGLIQPVAVKPGEGGRWTLIDGERRYQATKLLGRETIRAVVHRPASGVIEELMLISANMQQRKMTGAELSKQAERYGECLADLKRSGVEIPGRLRAAVAEAFGVSESRLAKLAAIRSNLVPALLERFDAGEINEAVAYGFARLPAGAQAALACCWKEATVNYLDAAQSNCAVKCPDGGEPMCATFRAVRAFNHRTSCGNSCCLSCPQLRICGGGCEAAKAKADAMQADVDRRRRENDELARERRREHEEKQTKKREAVNAAWDRFRQLRLASDVDEEDIADAFVIDTDGETLKAAELHDRDELLSDIAPADALTLTAALNVAELMGVSVYELAGRPGPKGGDAWEWIAGYDELPTGTEGMIACWGLRGFRTVNARDYAAALEAFPGDYDWWCVPVPPKEDEE